MLKPCTGTVAENAAQGAAKSKLLLNIPSGDLELDFVGLVLQVAISSVLTLLVYAVSRY